MGAINKDYLRVLGSLKSKIRNARQKVAVTVNTELLELYWEIGNVILQQQKQKGWGGKVIEKLAIDLKMEFPDFKGLSFRNLYNMKNFAEAWPGNPILQPVVAKLQSYENQPSIFVQPLVAQIPWAHHIVLLNKTKAGEERLFYLKKTVENGWSKSVLAMQIESQLHLRQGKAITNFELTFPKPHSDHARETLKNPYVFDFLGIEEEIQERDLEKALIQHIKKFTLELGRGFAYVGNQYNLTVENDDYFLDLLFYNYHLHCFVVFELKASNFKPEYAGKLNFYINIINEKVKGEKDLPTIGILLCKTPKETVVKYSLQNINAPIGVAEYEFTKALPKQLKGGMPTIEELEQELEKELEEFNEFNEQIDPATARLKAIKEGLKNINQEEMQMPAMYPVLKKLYIESLKPLFEEIINQLEVFEEDFYLTSYGWKVNVYNGNDITALDILWNDEMINVREIEFFYDLWGFRKGDVECYNENLVLKLVIETNWYGFILENNKDQQLFLKKLYHQPLNENDIQQIIDLMIIKIINRMEESILLSP
jgi:predicted nuclease of restriction endonuclease-like (RecB) superfamily